MSRAVLRSTRAARWAGVLGVVLCLLGAQGCRGVAEAMLEPGDGPFGACVKAGFWTGAVASLPATVVLLPVTAPLSETLPGREELAFCFAPSIATGAIVGGVMAVPGAILNLPSWIHEALASPPEPRRPHPAYEPDPWPRASSTPVEPAAPTTPPAPPRPCAPAPPGAPDVVPTAPPDALLLPPLDRRGALGAAHARCCHDLPIAPLLPPHEHEVGLTHALYEALGHDRAATEAERLLVGRADAVPLLLRGLADERRGPAAARILIERRDEDGIVLGLAGIAADDAAPYRSILLARAALLEIESRRRRERAQSR